MTSYTTGYQNVRGAERRRDRRLPLPIFTVRLDGVVYQTMNWSLGGLLIEGYTGERMGGDTVQIDIKAKDANADFRMRIAVKVIRVVTAREHRAAVRGDEHRDLRVLRALLRRPLQAALGGTAAGAARWSSTRASWTGWR